MDLLIIILAIALALVGLLGGKWFWQKMAESPIWEQIRGLVKIVGVGGTPVLFAITIFLVCMILTHPPEFFRQYVFLINIGSWFLFFYMLGCDASILRPEPGEIEVPHRNEKTMLKFHIKWDLLKKELFACIIAIAPAVGLLLLSWVSIYVFGMWIVSVVGFGMGFFFWEHLKETEILTSTFKRLFLLTTIAIGLLVGYGLYVDFSAGKPKSIQILLVVFTLLIWGLAWYMLGLCVVVFRAKYRKTPL
jgi:hypothetical protein